MDICRTGRQRGEVPFGTKRHKPLLAVGSAFMLAMLAACSGSSSDPQAVVERVQLLKERGDYRTAVIELKSVLQEQPKHGLARLSLGEIYLDLGDGLGAEKEFLWLVNQGLVAQHDVEIDLARARLLSENFKALVVDNVDQTLSDVLSVNIATQLKAVLIALHGHGYFYSNRVTDAAHLYDEALRLSPNEVEAKFGNALIAAHAASWDEARSLLTAITDTNPDFAPAWSLLGDIERYNRNLKDAGEAYTRAIASRVSNAHDLIGRSMVRIAGGNIEGAEDDATQLGRLVRNSPQLAFTRGWIEYVRENYGNALERFQEALSIQPDYTPASYGAGIAAAKLGLNNQAESYLAQFVARSPRASNGRKILASLYASRGDLAGAQEMLLPVLQQNPDDEQALSLLGSLSYAENDFARGTDLFQQVVEANPSSEVAFLQLGLGLLAQGQIKQAENALASLRTDPTKDLQAELLLATGEIAEGRGDLALSRAQVLKLNHPDAVEPWYIEGMAHLELGDINSARSALENARERDPNFFPALATLVSVIVKESGPLSAEVLLEDYLVLRPDHLGALLALSDLKLQQNRPEDAISLLEKARRAHLDAWRPRLLLARHYRVAGNLNQALKMAEEARSLEPTNIAVLAELGHAQLALGDVAQALDTYRAWVKRAPRSAQAEYFLAKASVSAGLIYDAKLHLEKTLILAPDNDQAKIVLARIFLTERSAGKAEQLINDLVTRFPKHPDVLALQGDLAIQKGRPEVAVEFFRQALARVPHSVGLVESLGVAQITAGQASKAVSTWESWLAEHPSAVAIRYKLANLYYLGNEWDASRKHYMVLESEQGSNAFVYHRLNLISAKLGDTATSLKYAEKAVALDRDNALFLSSLGSALVNAGRLDQALRAFEDANARAPEELQYAYYRADTLAKLGRRDEAVRILERLIDGENEFPQRADVQRLYDKLRGSSKTVATQGAG